jgi:hypothetical protein
MKFFHFDRTLSDEEKIFLAEVDMGEEKYRLLRLYNQVDILFIKSLFQSEEIPYLVDYEHAATVIPGVYAYVHILARDYDDAVEVVHEYIRNKLKSNESENEGDWQSIAGLEIEYREGDARQGEFKN